MTDDHGPGIRAADLSPELIKLHDQQKPLQTVHFPLQILRYHPGDLRGYRHLLLTFSGKQFITAVGKLLMASVHLIRPVPGPHAAVDHPRQDHGEIG